MPIGSIIVWSLDSMPTGSDSGKWLECNGQAIDSSAYPQLAGLMSNVPNYQGVFLRGYGSQYSYHYGTILHSSQNLGQLQGDSLRPIYGQMVGLGQSLNGSSLSGAFYYQNAKNNMLGLGDTDGDNNTVYFDVSKVTPVDNEIRPVNKAVKYLIKAK